MARSHSRVQSSALRFGVCDLSMPEGSCYLAVTGEQGGGSVK